MRIFLTVLGVLALILILIALLRVGAQVTYSADGLIARVTIGWIKITLYPRKKKPKKEKKAKKEKKPGKSSSEKKKKGQKKTAKPPEKPEAAPPKAAEESPPSEKAADTPAPEAPQEKKTEQTSDPSVSSTAAQPKAKVTESKSQAEKTKTAKKTQKKAKSEDSNQKEEEKKGGLPLPLFDLIELGIEAAGGLLSRLQIDCLDVEYSIPGKRDPASAAITYGGICAGGGGVVAVLENTFYRVKERHVSAQVDFDSDTPLVWVRFGLSIRIGQVVSLAARLGLKYLKLRKIKKQEDNKNGTESSDQ